jgi:hypothetical protein
MIAHILFFLYTTLFIYDCYTIQNGDYYLGLVKKDTSRNRQKYNLLSILTHVSIYQYMINGVAIFIIEPHMDVLNILFVILLEKMYNKIGFGTSIFIFAYMLFYSPVYLSMTFVVLSYIAVQMIIY